MLGTSSIQKALDPANVDAEQLAIFRRRLSDWGESNFQEFAWRRRIPFWQGLLAEVLLQRTRAVQVEPVFLNFVQRHPTAASLKDIDEHDVVAVIESLGLHWRAPFVHQLIKRIYESKGRLQRNRKSLESLPAVGPYAASAALTFHGKRRAPIVDSNIVRIAGRILGVRYDNESRRQAWPLLFSDLITPQDGFRRFSFALLDLSILICRPRNPLCNVCPVSRFCASASKFADESLLPAREQLIGNFS